MKRKSVWIALCLLALSTGLQSGAGASSDLGADPVPNTIIQEAPEPFEIVEEAPNAFGIFIVSAILDDPSPIGLLWRPWLSSWFLP